MKLKRFYANLINKISNRLKENDNIKDLLPEIDKCAKTITDDDFRTLRSLSTFFEVSVFELIEDETDRTERDILLSIEAKLEALLPKKNEENKDKK
jgi:hypothetical protein